MNNTQGEMEKAAVVKFLKNKGVTFELDEVEKIDDDFPDIAFRGEEFEIVNAPFSNEEVEGRIKKERDVISEKDQNVTGRTLTLDNNEEVRVTEYDASPIKMVKDLIIEPVKIKQDKEYDIEKRKNTTLLIYNRHIPEAYRPLFEELVKSSKKKIPYNFKGLSDLDFNNTGFKGIYLVGFEKNIRIFP